jgi:hypothetical protein
LDAGKLGKFNLPVTITPTSNTIFFIDPTNGNDIFPGTAAKPWQTVKSALDINQPSGFAVAAAANAGKDVVVTILGGANTENVGSTINTQALSAGSVTVLQAPFPKTFTLNMTATTAQLILSKGYKLQDINITSNVSGSSTTPPAAVKITHPTAGLASVNVNCIASSNKVICVEVAGAGSHTLTDVTVDVTAADASNVAIKNNANLSIVGGIVRPNGNAAGITLIDSKGVLTVTGLTVDMTGGGTHANSSTGIKLNAPGSLVTGSTIKVSNNMSATGIDVQGPANPSTVVGNTFKGSGNGIGVKGGSNLSPDVLQNNIFSGSFTAQVQP